jgi:hypothetical protein
MSEHDDDVTTSDAAFRKWIGRIAILALLLWGVQVLVFTTYNMLTESRASDGWLNTLLQDHYPAMVGIPLMAMAAFCIVISFKVAVGSPLEFEALGFKFRGASGPVIMWILCFLVLTLALRVLWAI